MNMIGARASSSSAIKDEVRYAYRLLLGREPDEAGLKHHARLLANGDLSPVDLAQSLLRSEEYQSVHGQISTLCETMIDDVKIYPWQGDRLIGDQLLATGDYEPNVLPQFLGSLKEGDHVLDVGANVGIYSLLAARRVGADGVVYAIEPIAKNVRSLCAGIVANGFQNVSVLPVAASDKRSAIAVLRHSDSSNGIVDSNVSASASTEYVPTQRLDELLAGIRRLDVVKIDIEGHEPRAWIGLSALIAKFRPLIFTEFSPVAIRNHSRSDPESYLMDLFRFASAKIVVLHREGSKVECEGPSAVMREWKAANQRYGLEGALHLDLVVDTRLQAKLID